MGFVLNVCVGDTCAGFKTYSKFNTLYLSQNHDKELDWKYTNSFNFRSDPLMILQFALD